MATTWKMILDAGLVLRNAYREQRTCIRDVHERLQPYLHSPSGTPDDYAVRPAPIPGSFLAARRNLFSSLFHSMYILLGCTEPRRILYGKLIHLYRIWVTSADNLLDQEDKIVVPMRMPGSSRVMRQVVAVMAADRVLHELIEDAVGAGTLTRKQADRLRTESLQHLLPSAAQEATEEGGILNRPAPDHVLNVIHRLKTGLLFNVAFVAPEIAETEMDRELALRLKDSLMQFGLGCQILDDIRDLARDLREKRHNYVLSWLEHNAPRELPALIRRAAEGEDRLYLRAPRAVLPAAERGYRLMAGGLETLGTSGLGYDPGWAFAMASLMFAVLDVQEVRYA